MKKKQLILALALVVVLALAGTAYYYYRRQKAAALDPTPKAIEDSSLTETSASDGPLGGSELSGGLLGGTATTLPVPTSSVADAIAAGNVVMVASSNEVSTDSPPLVTPIDSALSGVGATTSDFFPLRAGSTGPAVADLQTYLVRHYGVAYPQGITSQFDGATEAAVRKHLNRDTISHNFYQKVRKSLSKH